MSKGLEALENIKRDMEYVTRLDFVKPIVSGEVQQELYKIYHRETPELDIIEKELKEYELMKQTQIIICDKKISDDDLEKLKNQRLLSGKLEPCEVKPFFDETIDKKLKALEIIKRTAMKLVSLEDDTTICVKGRYAFYDNELYKSEELTQEEYDLLKEVLK